MSLQTHPRRDSTGGGLGRWLGGLLLVVLCIASMTPGLREIPPVDRDESRFAQASRQMLESGTLEGWVVPRVGDRPRLNKPPLIYWAQAASARLLGSGEPGLERNTSGLPTGDIWVFRVPSVVAAIVAVLLTWRLGTRMYPRDPRVGWLAGAMLGCSVIVMWDARQARADELLLAATTGAMWALWECWRRGVAEPAGDGARAPGVPIAAAWALWLLVAVGIMVKGPITPMVVGLSAIALAFSTRRGRWLVSLRPLLGVVIVAAVVGPWVGLVAGEVGWQRYWSIILDETLGRSVSPAEGHWGPPGYHLLLLPVLFWPGSMLTAAGLVLAWRRVRDGSTKGFRLSAAQPSELFLLSWLVPSWVVFEVIGTKLPHYTLPLYPAVALLSARAVCRAGESDGVAALGLNRRSATIGLGLWVVIGALITASAPAVLARLGGFVASPAWKVAAGAAVGVGLALVILAARSLVKRRYVLAQSLAIAASVVASAAIFGVVLPRLSALWLSSRVVNALGSIHGAESRPLAAIGYQEDSLTFLTRARVARLGVDGLAEWIAVNEHALIVIPVTRVGSAEAALGRPLTSLRLASGFNYSKGRWEDLVIAEVAPGSASEVR